jgi:thiol:disulfide interchange protein
VAFLTQINADFSQIAANFFGLFERQIICVNQRNLRAASRKRASFVAPEFVVSMSARMRSVLERDHGPL